MKNGDIVYGKITNILGYGAFVEVDEYDGLIHISEFSDHFVKDINEYVKIGQELKLKVLEVDEEAKRLKLSYKQIHKTRGVKCKIPTYQIGFETIQLIFPHWIEEAKKVKINEENSN